MRKWVPVQKEFSAEVISKGRVTIPKTVRKLLGIKEGSMVTLTVSIVSIPKLKDGVQDAE